MDHGYAEALKPLGQGPGRSSHGKSNGLRFSSLEVQVRSSLAVALEHDRRVRVEADRNGGLPTLRWAWVGKAREKANLKGPVSMLRQPGFEPAHCVIHGFLGQDAPGRVEQRDTEIGKPAPLLAVHFEMDCDARDQGGRNKGNTITVGTSGIDLLTPFAPDQCEGDVGFGRFTRHIGQLSNGRVAVATSKKPERRLLHSNGDSCGAAQGKRIGLVYPGLRVASIHFEQSRGRVGTGLLLARRRSVPERATPRLV